jgi:hypothetical protein
MTEKVWVLLYYMDGGGSPTLHRAYFDEERAKADFALLTAHPYGKDGFVLKDVEITGGSPPKPIRFGDALLGIGPVGDASPHRGPREAVA